MKVSIFSLLFNAKPNTFYEIFIFHSDISISAQDELIKYFNQFSNYKITFFNLKKYQEKYELDKIYRKNESIIKVNWPLEMYYFLFSFEVFSNYKKIIYIDIDTLVNSDLLELYSIELNTCFGAVKCAIIGEWIKLQNQLFKYNRLNELPKIYNKAFLSKDEYEFDKYSNSGVLLINLEKMKKVCNLNTVFLNARKYNFHDQDIIGYCFKNEITNIDLKYNFCIHFFNDDAFENTCEIFNLPINQVDDYMNRSSIIHYSIRPKPTYFFNHKTIRLIKKLGSINKYIDLISLFDINKAKEYYGLSTDEYEQVKLLSSNWKQGLYSFCKINRIYEKSFYIWAIYWAKMMNL